VILDDAGMHWATAHTFRTTVGDLVTKGVNGTEASNILGHARTSMTYDRYSDRRQRPTGLVEVLWDVSS
jgi:integrase